ncbi:potassium-transporting ATPase subunit KdpA, partial [Frankia sp. CpI1-P]
MSAWLQAAVVLVVLAAVHVPLGDLLACAFTSSRHLRAEALLYRAMRVDPDADQRWSTYAGCVLAFSGMSILLLYVLLRVQAHLPFALGHHGMPPAQAWNTAVSFVTNTSWQSYAGEGALGHLTQLAGITVHSFLSAAVGLTVALTLIRGLTRSRTDRVGNFWCDLVRGVVRVLLPLSAVFAVVLLAGGAVQNLHGFHTVPTLAGHTQAVPGGPVASQEAIKLMSGDGGGFYNVNSAHPFENPKAWTNVVEIILMLLIPSAIPRMYGRMVRDTRQGWLLLGVVAVL